MQTILGSNGQIGQELVKELAAHYTTDLRLVSRHPRRVNPHDQLVSADLMNFEEANQAIAGSEVVYFTVGLPMNSALMEEQFIPLLQNVIKACEINHSKLVFFDNTYMYPKDNQVQTEATPFAPQGRKSQVRADMANLVLQEMCGGKLHALICRAPEFYGPGKTQSITMTMIFNRVKAGKKAIIPLNADALRSLIFTPDASRAMALLGNTEDAYDQTWHLPTAEPISYRQLGNLIQQVDGRPFRFITLKLWQFKLGGLFNQNMKELAELLPRYAVDNLFSSEKFQRRFPNFRITSYREGIEKIMAGD